MESSETPRSRGDRAGGLPQIEASRLHAEVTESLRTTVYFTPKPDGQATPRLRPGSSSSSATDYFSSKRRNSIRQQHDRPDSPVRTPRPADFIGSPTLRTPALGHAQIAGMPPGSLGRPGLYHLGSRSMVDLSLSKKGKETTTSPSITADPVAGRRKSKPLPGAPTIHEDEHSTPKPPSVPQDIFPSTPTLRRQRSMPTYKVSSDPPPYPSFHPRWAGPMVLPRDEEGMERLPPYSNAVYLAAVIPRKVEFTSPGVQAKDRKWRRVLCVLEGTAFRVYKCPPSIAGVSAIESWWEKKVGVGDITVVNTGAVTQSGIRVSAVRGRADSERAGKEDTDPASPDPNTRESEPPPAQQALPPSRSKLRLPGSLLHPNRSNTSRTNSTPSRLSVSSSQSSNSSQLQTRRSTDPSQDDHSSISVVARASSDALSSRRTSYVSSNAPSPRSATFTRPTAGSPPASDSTSSFFRSRILHTSPPDAGPKQPPEPNPKDLIRAYTLQNAESGLASDYGKRKNVIRVRMEGEQFLLQAPDVAAVIDWIEGIQAATNIALDLDERPMPKGPMFPRRRRRRPRPQGVAGSTATATANA
ncbi:uncharacterized protein B0H18DRAFT_928162 [Fomitopsis serialis]|uniref:uncharacterized protein n=1 Tax=Fomitopsis serialis TaxID=139415 RepID=UPI0020078E00|nr:uncharacterized protein B0H18DRAFT_928162 [Neoantrodia serialis]KAH9933754.1 hypothetical protein B0H18DRAFT_928162 [Neoantrodia serialis]